MLDSTTTAVEANKVYFMSAHTSLSTTYLYFVCIEYEYRNRYYIITSSMYMISAIGRYDFILIGSVGTLSPKKIDTCIRTHNIEQLSQRAGMRCPNETNCNANVTHVSESHNTQHTYSVNLFNAHARVQTLVVYCFWRQPVRVHVCHKPRTE